MQTSSAQDVLAAQRAAFNREPYPSVVRRRDWLTALEHMLLENEQAICTAISADFGHRPTTETRLLELFPSLSAIRHARHEVPGWMKPQRRRVSMWFQPGQAAVRYQPLGVIGIIVPWNYPLFLTIGPLVGALAAGNRAMIKISEHTPAFGSLLASLISRTFPADLVQVVLGDADVGREFSGLRFDHLLFTGSGAVARDVMASAARHLTPVTLELGGKSPAIVAPEFNLTIAARRLMAGKLVNAGQTCVAPDYALAHNSQIEPLVDSMRRAARGMYATAASEDYASIANDRHHARLMAMLEDARSQGARIEPLLDLPETPLPRRFAPVVVLDAKPAMRILREEIFGPILPILGYKSLEDAIGYVNSHERPLALYLFDDDERRRDDLLARTASGGVTINDTLLHAAQDALPFGGVGESGMGRYHGVEGFRAFSQVRGVYRPGKLAMTSVMYPPYGGPLAKRLLSLMLGKLR